MNRTIFIVFTTLLFMFALGTFVIAAEAKIDEPAPTFKLKDNKGKEYALADFKGKYVVLEWVNFDCPFVRKHYDSGHMQKLQKTYQDKDVVWLSICSSAEGKQGYFAGKDLDARLKKEKAVPTAYLLDESGKVGNAYGAKTTPHMYIIDTKGILIYAGGIDDKPSTKINDVETAQNYVISVLDAALAGKPIPVKTSTPYGCSVKYKMAAR
jgi:peroxiredoxin